MSAAPTYKPANYNSVSPYLVVTDTAASIQFLKSVFNAEELRRIIDPKNADRVIHAEVRLDDTVVMLGDCVKEVWPAQPCHVHVYVPDVDATFQKALDHGATSVQKPEQKGDDDKRGGFKDTWGITWWIATKVQ